MDTYIKLAHDSIKYYFLNHKALEVPDYIPVEILSKKAGVFVSYKKKGELRGCIGTFLPVYGNVALEIINNAIAAATEDPRFMPIQKSELNDLDISVDVLSAPEKVTDTAVKSLDPKKYGVIVESDYKRGLLLPDLEGVDTIEEQIAIACDKAGIDQSNEKFIVYKFTVERHGKD